MKTLLIFAVTLAACACAYVLLPNRSEGVIDAIVAGNGDVAILVRTKKALLIEPFEESLWVGKNHVWLKYYVDHEAPYWSSTRLILNGGSVKVVRGSSEIASYGIENNQYVRSGKDIQPIGRYSLVSGFTLHSITGAEPKTSHLDP